MKPTIRVSIGGMEYTLDEDAYLIMNEYLESLNKHFDFNSEKTEIIADIEMRISELLQLRLNNKNSIVSIENITEVLSIIGNPHDFGDEESSIEQITKEDKDKFEKFRKKRIYRDREHTILGGVCSGLSHYFRIDPVIVRIVWVFIAIILWIVSVKAMLVVIMAYIILWIIVPKAKTFAQRVSMRNAASPIENIEKRASHIHPEYKGSGLKEVLRLILNIIVGVFGALFFLLFIISFIGILWINFDTQTGGGDLLTIFGFNNLNFKVFSALPILLPLLGISYVCYKIVRRSSFSTRDWAISIFAIVLWVGSGLYVANKIIGISKVYRYNETATEEFFIPSKSDTLYVKAGQIFESARQIGWMASYKNSFFMKVKDSGGQDALFSHLNVEVSQNNTLTDYKVIIEKRAFEESPELALRKVRNARLKHEVKHDGLIVSPHLYNSQKHWDRELFSIRIETPIGKTVIVEYPF